MVRRPSGRAPFVVFDIARQSRYFISDVCWQLGWKKWVWAKLWAHHAMTAL